MVTCESPQASRYGRHLPATALLLFLVFGSSCKEKATEDEIEKMCTHLTELRGKPDDRKMRDACIAEAKKEEVTKKQALCRIYAVNKQEYWIRCRTGEPRPPKK